MFVERDKDGKVQGIYANLQPGYAEEELADDNPEIVAFRSRMDAIMNAPRIDPLAELQAKVEALQAALEAKDPTLETAIATKLADAASPTLDKG